ncbi:MAG: TetR family transcriptional regulator C-terminal domain-containing protein, partial [Flavobacterium sp.]
VQLTSLRESFKEYVAEILTDDYRLEQEKFQKFQEKGIQESAWLQLMMTIKFWMDDDSAAFEKTDIFIEKSVNASFELMNVAPLNHLIDFGKFLFKEKIYSKQ